MAGRIKDRRAAFAARATEIRTERAEIKKAIAKGKTDLCFLLRDPAPPRNMGAAARIPIGQLVRSIPGIGEITMRDLLADLSIPSDERMEEISHDDRSALATEIERSLA